MVALGILVVIGLTLVITVAILNHIFVGRERAAKQRAQQLAEAQATYQQALAALTAAPTDPERTERALQWGRYYAALTREGGLVTVFDEVALANDIRAATAGAATAAPAPSVAERLAQLDALRERGLVSPEEYVRQRRTIVDAI